MGAGVRLFVDHPLEAAQSVPLSREQAHYLFGVMRLGPGDPVTLINGRHGEWRSEVSKAGKKGGILTVTTQTRPLQMPPDLWLVFAPIKKARTDFIIEKAVEMGARRIVPVQTQYTNERFRSDKAEAHAIEAAEQCEATYVPEIAPMVKLDRLLAEWPEERRLMFCDEGLAGHKAGLSDLLAPPAAILIGPEGGFAPDERERLAALPCAEPVALGPRILRAETAAVAAMSLWQARHGDWT